MNGNSISLGRVFGIPIKVSQTLLILSPLLALLYSRENLLLGLIIVVALFASVALHELGHSVVATRFGCHVMEIELGLLGGVAKMTNLPTRPKEEILIALAGPAVSLILGVIGFFSGVQLLYIVGAINLLLCGFNLLPCFPMDGGRVLRAALSLKKGRLEATRLATRIGTYFCAFFVFFGLARGYFILALIGGYIYFAGKRELMMVMLEQRSNAFTGQRRDDIEVEVSPPPYARGGRSESVADKMKNWFRG